MDLVQDALKASDLPSGTVLTIGNYDGVHRGQAAILEKVVERARAEELSAVLVTFEPHPVAVLRPDAAPAQLTTPQQKSRLLEEIGLDAVLQVRFNEAFARTPAEQFVRSFLHGKLGAREIYVGTNFAFGHQREGDLDLLRRIGVDAGFAAHGIEEVLYQGEAISSTRIRRCLAAGEVEAAAEMLGRSYSVSGTIARGDRMGQRLGWPTINLEVDNELLPMDGVYATRVELPSFPATFDSVTNIGTRPTVYENYRHVVESHILDFQADVYGQRVELGFNKRLREERIFPTVMDLSAQIRRDVEATREYFLARRRLGEGASSSQP